MIRNAFTRSWEGREQEIKPYPHQLREVGEPASNAGRIGGDVENGVLPSGQSAGLITAIESAGDVVRRTAEEAARIIGTFAQIARQATDR
jgi:enoyl-[acyl-carrier protein] reductase II